MKDVRYMKPSKLDLGDIIYNVFTFFAITTGMALLTRVAFIGWLAGISGIILGTLLFVDVNAE